MSDSAPVTRKVVEERPASPQLDFVFGRFDLSGSWSIPYFATTMSLRQAKDGLTLVSELPGSEDIAWKIDDLYQRDIDWGRVRDEIVPYLSDPEQPQFFNSLTIAFLPYREGEIRDSFDGAGWAAPQLTDTGFKKPLQIGPIRLGYFADWSDPAQPEARIGQLKWNPTQLYGIAIDGQHRLAAIKELVKDPNSNADGTRVPVILIVPDKQIGYRAPKGTRLVDLMRRLFIDLNKHAKSVSRPRQILLDDRDPHSLCVRSLVGRAAGCRKRRDGEKPAEPAA